MNFSEINPLGELLQILFYKRSDKSGDKSFLFCFNPIWTGGGGGKMAPMRVFAKYLKHGLADLHQTLGLLRPLYKSSFKIESLRIDHSLLP